MERTQAERASATRTARRLVQVAGLVFYLLSVQGIAAAGVGAHVYFNGGSGGDLVLPLTGAMLAICYAVVGYHLRRYRVWARNFAFAFATIGLFFFPVGTVLGALIVLCIDRANRARVFPARPKPARRPALVPALVEEPEASSPLVRFEPELSAERAG